MRALGAKPRSSELSHGLSTFEQHTYLEIYYGPGHFLFFCLIILSRKNIWVNRVVYWILFFSHSLLYICYHFLRNAPKNLQGTTNRCIVFLLRWTRIFVYIWGIPRYHFREKDRKRLGKYIVSSLYSPGETGNPCQDGRQQELNLYTSPMPNRSPQS